MNQYLLPSSSNPNCLGARGCSSGSSASNCVTCSTCTSAGNYWYSNYGSSCASASGSCVSSPSSMQCPSSSSGTYYASPYSSSSTCSTSSCSMTNYLLPSSSNPNCLGSRISAPAATTMDVPLSFGQEIPQASYTRTYTAVPQVVGVMAAATVTATLTASSQAISFSSIPITGLTSNLTAAHIHGPCPDANPCNNAPIAYVICSGNCPGGTSPTIPAFTVDITQLNAAGVASAAGLYQGIIAGNKLYYLNFHTST